MTHLGKLIDQRLNHLGWERKRLADELDIVPVSVSRWLRPEGDYHVSWRFYPLLSAVLKVPLKTILEADTLRHSFADRLSQLAPILDVQEAGRWGSWQSMRRYMKRNNQRASSAVQQLKSPIPLDPFLSRSRGRAPAS